MEQFSEFFENLAFMTFSHDRFWVLCAIIVAVILVYQLLLRFAPKAVGPVHHFLQQFVHKAVRHSVQPRHALAPGRRHRHPIGIEFIVHRAAVQISADLPGVRQLHRVTVDPLFVLHIPHTGAVAEYNII